MAPGAVTSHGVHSALLIACLVVAQELQFLSFTCQCPPSINTKSFQSRQKPPSDVVPFTCLLFFVLLLSSILVLVLSASEPEMVH